MVGAVDLGQRAVKLLCVNCKHHDLTGVSPDRVRAVTHFCRSPELGTDVVTGENNTRDCYENRAPQTHGGPLMCGPGADWFKAKDSSG